MTWLNGSISSIAVVCAGLALGLTGGCASRRQPAPPPVRGYANLDQLARRHPGWSGVSQYDAALRRLEDAASRLPQSGQPDQAMAVLPALTGDGVSAAAEVAPEKVAQTGRRLNEVQQNLLADQRRRREMARADQMLQNQNRWRQEARDAIVVPADPGNDQPDFQIQLLQANIIVLTKTLTETKKSWNPSQPPPPKLKELMAKVEAEGVELTALIAERDRQKAAAQARRQQSIQAVRAARASYVQDQTALLENKMRPDDERQQADQAAQAALLTRQRTALLTELRRPLASSLPASGNAGIVTLPRVPEIARASLSEVSLRAAETRLREQRARWIKFLYDDTRAAAQDAAGQRGWDVTFGPPRPGDRDLTAALTQVISSSVWRL